MILFLHGPDTFRSRQRLNVLIGAFQKKFDPDGQNVVRLDGEILTVEEFRKAVGTAGLFAKRRLIVIEGVLTRNKKAAVVDGVLDALGADAVPEDHVVIFWEEELPTKATKLQAYLLKTKAEPFPLLKDAQLRTWITQEVKKRGGRIDRAAVERLVGSVGADLWRMTNEIEKLIAFVSDRTVAVEDVDAVVLAPTESRLFSFTDALGSRNPKAALRELNRLLLDGLHPLALVQAVGRHLMLLIRVQDASSDSKHPSTIAKRLGLHPYVAQKALEQTSKFERRELVERYARLVELDRKLKSSRIDSTALLDGFVLSLA